MTRAIQTTTASGDAITLEASATPPTRGRMVAQLEHNAMQALALVRTTLAALQRVVQCCDRANLLLSRSRGVVEPAIKPELRRTFGELAELVNGTQFGGEPVLTGGTCPFALEDPWNETGEPFAIELPDLHESTQALAAVDLNGAANALQLGQRTNALLGEVRVAQKQLGAAVVRLNQVLFSQRRGAEVPGADRSALVTAKRDRQQDENFVSMIGRVRDRVLTSGGAALLVQGGLSARATSLLESERPAAG
ncbi:MAG: hypothetical protein RL701_6034 [Pseudomonadota bacterium]